MKIRLAEPMDIKQLIKMRWDFTIEDDERKSSESFDEFAVECESFLEQAMMSSRWFIWVAEDGGNIVSHSYLELVHKVPRPGRVTKPFAFMTNVYTRPDYRNQGVGSQLLKTINQWVEDNQYEFVIVWPSDESINYYKKNGYVHCNEPMEFVYKNN
ncbi:GNAT superfamily N-acetyltransferase [Alkalibacillus flavidus]|uniref:GNAT superfamily N-acetyltransferase n=1 Tax=Alkalibacillus flavidus TaxID=546021 RepID=A0ABV2KV70_9BACI